MKTGILGFAAAFFLSLLLTAQQPSAVDTLQLEKLIEFSKSSYTDEFMLIHRDTIICNWKSTECDSLVYNTASMTKSWTGLVIGILIDRGLIADENAPVCKYLPEWEDGCRYDVRIKHLLTMTSGLKRRRGAEGLLAENDINSYVLDLKLDTVPGVSYQYSNESVQLLGIIIERVAGKRANEYFREVLFEPLGMDSTSLAKDPAGNDAVLGGSLTTVQDASKVGLLMLNGGRYGNLQVVSEEWVRKSVSPGPLAPFYGYLWWLDNNSAVKNFAATGDFGQMTIVFPGLELVYVRKQACNKEISGNMTWMGPAFLELVCSVIRDSGI